MKKSRGVKRKVNHSKKKFYTGKNFFPVLAIIVFLAFAVLLSFTHQTTGNIINGNADSPINTLNSGQGSNLGTPSLGAGTSFISDLFTQWGAGNLDVNISKYLFWLMLTGLIWGALSFAKFPPQGVFQALIAIPAGFLATAYITPGEVFTILTSYTALGITLSFLLPFAILLFVSAMLTSNEHVRQMSIPKIMLETLLWIFYIVILGYKIISGIISGEVPFGLNLTLIIMIGVFAISLLILVFNSKFRRWMWRIGLDIRRAQAEAARVEAEESQKTAEAVERARK
jgi:hypothetical protein